MIYTIDLLPILASLLFLSMVVLWVAIKNYKNFIITFFIIPLTLVSVITSYTTVQRLLGYPVQAIIPDESVYITHLTGGEFIYVWAFPPGADQPRAYSIPNTEQNKKAMEEAAEGQEQGRGQQISQKTGEGEEGMMRGVGETDGGEYEVYDFIIQDSNNMKGN